ncbi:MAG: ABC transporter ATP-binding protein [Thermoleophilia bacterium]
MRRPPHELRARALELGYGGEPVVRGVDVAVPDGRITMIVGANACGKSTLLRGLARLLRPQGGEVVLDGRRVQDMRNIEVARVIGMLPQTPVAPDGITVGDLVGRGRYPHQGWFRHWDAGDEAAVTAALEATGTAALVARPVAELSGGQRQRVWVAMALAQDTDLLLLDEPTTFLDIAHQVELLDLLTDLNRGTGATIVVVLHDLNLACRYADHLIAMKDGGILAEGPPAEVVDTAMIAATFGLDCEVVRDPVSGTPMVVPRGRHHASAPAGAAGDVAPRHSR